MPSGGTSHVHRSCSADAVMIGPAVPAVEASPARLPLGHATFHPALPRGTLSRPPRRAHASRDSSSARPRSTTATITASAARCARRWPPPLRELSSNSRRANDGRPGADDRGQVLQRAHGRDGSLNPTPSVHSRKGLDWAYTPAAVCFAVRMSGGRPPFSRADPTHVGR